MSWGVLDVFAFGMSSDSYLRRERHVNAHWVVINNTFGNCVSCRFARLARFIGEETTSSEAKVQLTDAPTWVIDPIDGTMNFVHGLPHTCISVALLIDKVSVIGIVYNPIINQLFTAIKGRGAFLNDAPIKVSGEKGNAYILYERQLTVSF